MRRVIIESPYAGDIERNKRYLEWAISDSIRRGEAPFASHRMYPGALNDDEPSERELGIAAGYAWWEAAEAIVFYCDLGMSPGMERAQQVAFETEKHTEIRFLWGQSNA